MEVELPRPGDLLAPEGAERPSVDAADELAAQVPVEQRVLPVPAAGLPPRRLGRQQRARSVPVKEDCSRLRFAQGDQPGLVADQLPHGRALLPGLAELGPVASHRIVETDQAAVE